MSQNGSPLDARLAALLDRRRARNQLRTLTTVPPGTADFSSNGYLSLSTHPAVQAAFLAQLQEQAPRSLLGSGGSRLLDGNSSRAERLERTIADFHRAPAGLLFNSAMDANLGLFSCVPQPGDAVIYDELIHASVHDGLRLSRVGVDKRIAFAHNCVWRNEKNAGRKLKPLETVLLDLQTGVDGHLFQSGERNVFIAVEGVYSMDGDVAPLKGIVACVSRSLPAGNGYLIVDEAHSTGIFGDRGRGLVCELGLEDGVWAQVLGFGKAMGCSGGIVLCSETTRSYLVNYARSLIYTTAIGFPALAAVEVTYDFITNGRAEPLLANLRRMVRLAHTLLLVAVERNNPPPYLLHVDAAEPKSPIIPVFTSQPRSLAKHCQKRGFMVRPIVAPTVPLGSERVRVCIHAGNTPGEVEGLVAAVEEWVVAAVSRTIDSKEGAGKVALTSPSKGRTQTDKAQKPKL
ncbi:pyridoxal phosphate-dependent transferase [Coniochaeta sp. 2T2.1]|nr:pyridoxal phosphate-dependent transferase [Coniochaeta sp. 2T2.1]